MAILHAQSYASWASVVYAMVLCLSLCSSRAGTASKLLNGSARFLHSGYLQHILWKEIWGSTIKKVLFWNFVQNSGPRKILPRNVASGVVKLVRPTNDASLS